MRHTVAGSCLRACFLIQSSYNKWNYSGLIYKKKAAALEHRTFISRSCAHVKQFALYVGVTVIHNRRGHHTWNDRIRDRNIFILLPVTTRLPNLEAVKTVKRCSLSEEFHATSRFSCRFLPPTSIKGKAAGQNQSSMFMKLFHVYETELLTIKSSILILHSLSQRLGIPLECRESVGLILFVVYDGSGFVDQGWLTAKILCRK